MDRFWSSQRTCERTRAFASLELDGELSQLERVLLASHVRTCEACAVAVDEMRALAAIVRSAPLEQPRKALLAAPSEARGSRRRQYARFALAAAAAVLVSGLGALVASLGQDREPPAVPTQGEIALLRPEDDLQRIRSHRRRETETPPDLAFPLGRAPGV